MTEIVINKCHGGFSISKECVEHMARHGNQETKKMLDRNESDYFYLCDTPRHDKILVNAVKELGSKANGEYSRLEIVEIDGSIYKIDEYDGMEWVVEPKDINWTKVK